MYIKVMFVAQIYYILVGLPPFIEGFETRNIASSSLYSIPQSMVSYDIAIVSLGLDLGGLIRYLPIEGAPFLVLS